MSLCLVAVGCGDDGAADGDAAAPTSAAESDDARTHQVEGLIEPGVLTYVSTGNFAPLSFVGPSGDVQGYTHDLATEIAGRLGLELNHVTVDQVALLAGLEAGNYDLTTTGLWPSPERQETFLFTVPDGASGDVLLTTKDKASSGLVKGLPDVEGLRLGAVNGSLRETKILDNPSWGYTDYLPYAGEAEAVLDLRNDRIDAIFDDPLTALYTLQHNDDLIVVGEPVDQRPFAMALRKDNVELQQVINEVLEEMISDGTVATLQIKYYGETLPRPTDINQKPPYEALPEP